MTVKGMTAVLRVPRFGDGRIANRDPYTALLVALASVLVGLALLGPVIAPYSPSATNVLEANVAPSLSHIMGTDSLGRDIFSRILWGARVSFAAALVIVAISLTLGTTIALFSAWIGGRFDLITNGFLNAALSVPGILVAIIAVTVLGAGFLAPVLAMAFASAPYVARVLRSVALQERSKPYIEALILSGIAPLRINLHVIRGILPIILAQATFGFGVALLEFGAMSFLGLGVQPPTAEWGAMVVAGRNELLAGHMQQTLCAGAMIVISVLVFSLLGERLMRKLEGTA